ncbi:MAG TPA: hypothetical protein VK152_13540 [Paludibacter sp.]|nr:hypothetical protein [Paludibacter sp.]
MTNSGGGNPASCRVYYPDGTNESTGIAASANRTIYNYTLKAASKAAISQIEFRLFGGPSNTTITIEDMYLTNTPATTGITVPTVDPLHNDVFDIYGNRVKELQRDRIYISGGKKFIIH